MNKGSRGKAIVCIRLIAMSSGLCIFRYSFQYFKIIRNVIYLMSSILLQGSRIWKNLEELTGGVAGAVLFFCINCPI